MTTAEIAVTVGIMAMVTFASRAAPFVLFPPGRSTPRFVAYLGRVLPFAISGMLVVYCLKNVQPLSWPHGLPELLGIAAVAAVFGLFKNALAAIAAGTVLYMALVQAVF